MTHQEFLTLPRSSSTSSNRSSHSRKIIPSSSSTNFRSSSSSSSSISHVHFSPEIDGGVSDKLLLRSYHRNINNPNYHISKAQHKLSSFFRSLLNIFSFPTLAPTCKWLTIPSQLSVTPTLGRKVTGTLFGNRRGHVSFAVQLDPKSEPVLLLEMAVSTASLVKEMASGLVRIALESEKSSGPAGGPGRKLFQEPTWTMYCNGRRCGYAVSRACGLSDSHVLSVVRSVSVGAGVIPVVEDDKKKGSGAESEGELLYMRARFERVVGSRDSEAFYMMNPDGNGGPELSIFLLRL